MIPRRSIFLLAALPLRGDERAEIVEWLGKFAGFLTEENAEGFLRWCAKELRGRLETNIRALVRNNEIASSIAVISITGEGEQRDVGLDWFLELQSRANSASSVRRRERLKFRMGRVRKGWSVLEMDSVSLFAPVG